MQLIVLGSGTSIPIGDRSSPSLALIVEGSTIVFDLGPGALCQLARAGLDYEKVERIFITHFHPDHTADIIHFLFASRNPTVLGRRLPFVITGPNGLKGLLTDIQNAFQNWLTLTPDAMKIDELETGITSKREYECFSLIACPVDHTPHSLAYRVDARSGKSLVYSGDTGYCDDIIEIASGTDLLVLECSFPDGKEMPGHLTPSQAGKIASMAKVRRLLLTHFYPECLETDIEAQCRKTYQGEIILASDLLRVSV
ncbi:Beta-lactamase domain protein [uncultured Desulfobacterium sp.]|uniref:Beta-lactamase domain protein n=1 Tax=uncultured Desulfobacterium sp. TaxID=201089 RepID=A0A445N196_9BACT|nr:Beta-lactamase domain protein [uncultured Desulfobacterium sp.]